MSSEPYGMDVVDGGYGGNLGQFERGTWIGGLNAFDGSRPFRYSIRSAMAKRSRFCRGTHPESPQH